MWPQRWLGEAYSTLFAEFGRGAFTAPDAIGALHFEAPKLHVCFSKLHSVRALIVFKRSKPRLYRLLDPRSLVLGMSGEVRQVEFEQEEYVQMVCDVLRAVRDRIRLVSFCVYGSVARGQAKPSSDLDILLVSDDFDGSIASRIDQLSFVDPETSEETEFLRKRGLSTNVSLMPLRREEAAATPVFFLDITVDSKILYDRDEFLGRILTRLRAKLDLAGSRRVERERGWYWDLRPDYSPGMEEIVI